MVHIRNQNNQSGTNMMKTRIKWVEGMEFVAFDKQNHRTVFDSKPTGVETAGPTPMEVFLQALGACSAMDIAHILTKRRKKIDRFTVEVEGIRASDFPKIFTDIKLKFTISGEGIKDYDIQRAVSLSCNKLCSIMAMIDTSKTKINVEYEVV